MSTNDLMMGGNMLHQRRRFMNRVKPYDCEVEYLGNGSDQTNSYILIDRVIDGYDNDLYAKFELQGMSKAYTMIVGSGATSGNNCYRVSNDNTIKSIIRLYNGSPTQIFAEYKVTYGETYEISILHDYTYEVNGDKGVLPPAGNIPNTDPILLMGNPDSATYMKLYYFKWVKGGITELDLIPVRKGNVGYMYDKVSGKLYGNAGTGKFIVGPDIIDKPYDAEVEYLELNEESGKVWIETDYIPQGQDIDIDVTFMVLGYSDNNPYSVVAFNATTSEDAQAYRIIRNGNHNDSLYIYNGSITGGANTTILMSFGVKYNLKLYGTTRTYELNGVRNTLKPYCSVLNTLPLKLLGIESPSYPNRYAYQRLYSFKLTKGNRVELDLIPVRIGNVGLLYNKVDGKLLFANQGSGRFMLGPDIN